ncbi:MAG: asparagine--tRNA ligase [Flavobacteriales bacterium]|nr:asparagine--tRNA ligase [Flavobacteriales bacterium]
MAVFNIKSLFDQKPIGETITVKAWVRTHRMSKSVSFIALNDGSTINNIQVVVEDLYPEEFLKQINTGASLAIEGLVVASQGKGQQIELQAKSIEILGTCSPDEYPIQPKRHSLEFLREKAHLRMRTSTFSAVFRVRHHLTFAIHQFFHERGFYNIHTPIITASDAEGAGETFKVTNFDLNNIPKNDDGTINYEEDFFGKETNLTVSGQLEGELAAMALSKIYTFGPTFRAENSNTSRHLAEFWMMEPEIAFADLDDLMDVAEGLLKYVCQYALDHCADDMEFLNKRFENEEKTKKANERAEMNLVDKLRFVIDNDFKRLTYTEAIDILRNSKPNKKKKFNYLINEWGADLQSEHERYLVEKEFKRPVILTDYPKDIKAFYMKQSEDGKTVRAMDLLVPGIGELMGGSQREESHDKLLNRMNEMNIPQEDLWWYLETRKFGTVPHSGFGLGFERLVLFVTGMGNIRDVIPFPRAPKSAEF